MIQLIEKDNYLIISTHEILVLWLIDYLSLKLIKLKEFIYRYIYNFSSVINNNKIVVICDGCVKIFNKDLV